MRIILVALIMFMSILIHPCVGQIIFPGESGVALLDQVRDDYSPNDVLSLANAKDTIYSRIDITDGRVHTIYCDHSLDLPEGVDPSVWMFDGPNGGRGAEAINLEHVYPRSKGAQDGSMASSDMHHLYPSRASVNGDRASFPFADIDDNQTSKWYLFTNVLTNPPSMNRDLYSEFVNGRFEPRESKKGDIARAVFYFYTIYEDRALAADPDFFESMRTTLCNWHIADEADEAEKIRSQKIAEYQGNENPFALDCTLATRSYCIDLDLVCNPISAVHDIAEIKDIKGYINARGHVQMEWQAQMPGRAQISVYNAMGHLMHQNGDVQVTEGQNSYEGEWLTIASGIYFIQFTQSTSDGLSQWSGPLFIAK